jgi:hypothetical protein
MGHRDLLLREYEFGFLPHLMTQVVGEKSYFFRNISMARTITSKRELNCRAQVI